MRRRPNKGFQRVLEAPRSGGCFTSPNAERLAKKPVAVRLPISVDATVRRIAEERGISVGDWIREVISAHLKDNNEPAQ
ncbi:hypothetical protein NG798_02090 [Ancylothrix sp. C2]|uniref:hypothetical protein n=1 Tax=Ancylothrix sp. D3o TaxID=2953691 RepID=UPI0021BA47AB|nr:hypothetical protein [Ancylothrix sp. D3o]MCT7948572.1 hypothetical protein [Ancylothrix sp. D3o]